MNPDFLELLRALCAAEARFLVVGAYAVTFHGPPRSTGDLDLWVEPTAENARRVWNALLAFGAPLEAVALQDLQTPDVVVQFGLPPRRIDLLTSLTGLQFDAAWARRVEADVEGVRCPILSRDDLVTNKRAVGRPRDLADIERLVRPEAD